MPAHPIDHPRTVGWFWWLYGLCATLVFPIVCVFFVPIVFDASHWWGPSPTFETYAEVGVTIAIVASLVWRLAADRVHALRMLFGIVLLCAGLAGSGMLLGLVWQASGSPSMPKWLLILACSLASAAYISQSRTALRHVVCRAPDRVAESGSLVVFDLSFGVLLPIVGLAVAPLLLFHPTMGPLRGYQLFVYIVVSAQVAALSLWLAARPRGAGLARIQFGLLAGGSLGATVVGMILLPLSLFALRFVVGVLGILPFVTAFVFLRQASKAWALGGAARSRRGLAIVVVAGLAPYALALGSHCCLRHRVVSSLARIERLGCEATPKEVRVVQTWYPWVLSADKLIRAHRDSDDPTVKETLAKLYRGIFGGNIELAGPR